MALLSTPTTLRRTEETAKVGREFSGVWHAVRFWTDATISLLEVGFVGVNEKSPGNSFNLGLEIVEEFTGRRRYFLKWKQMQVQVGQAFSIVLDQPVVIWPDTDIMIKFYLKPINEGDEGKVLLNFLKDVASTTLEEESGVKFVFSNSSGAINQLRYRVKIMNN